MNAPAMNRKIRDQADVRALEAATRDSYLPVASTWEMLARGRDLYGDRTAFRFLETGVPGGPSSDLSHADLFARVTQAANLFADLGVGPDDAVAMLAPNIPEAHFALWGGEAAGRACPVNNLLNTDHIVDLVEAAGAKVLVALGPDPDLDIWTRALEVRDRAPGLNAVLSIGGAQDGAADFAAALAGYPADRLTSGRTIRRGDIASCFHTGGTTGAPKLALHTHGNELHVSWSACLMLDVRPEDAAINGFPLFHVAGSMVFGMAFLAGGASIVLPTRLGMRHPDIVARYWEHVAEHRISILPAVPTLLATLLSRPVPETDMSSVRGLIIGGSPLPTEMADAFEKSFGIPVRNVFGMTESSGIIAMEPFHASARVGGSCGLPLPHTEVIAAALDGPDGVDVSQPMPAGVTGVLAARGGHVSPGYTDPERNPGTFTDDGWLISGDLGHVDENGYVFVTGRSKDVIIRGAHNIDPAMVEEMVNRHPAVEMSAAIGQPDAYAGELPVVYVALKPGAAATEEEILAFVTPLIAERPAVPKRVHILPDLPQTALGKVFKPALRLQSIERVFGEALAPMRDYGVTVAVTGQQSAAGLSAHIALGGADDAAKERVRSLLRGFPVDYEMEVSA
ncbi:MAG: acyl-CoA synthetase [Rhodospirillaceae bacterium]|nr:acyl-CoA synthetase [Rhodospirillaceae bacterium]